MGNPKREARKRLELLKRIRVGKIFAMSKLLPLIEGTDILFKTDNNNYMPASKLSLRKWRELGYIYKVRIDYNWMDKPHNCIHVSVVKFYKKKK